MDPMIELNENKKESISNNEYVHKDFNEKIVNSNLENIIKPNRKKKIIIISSVFIILILFILLLIFIKSKHSGKKKKIPIIMDVDEGGDDMVALIVAQISKKYEILGLTTVSPDQYIDNVTDIWLRFLEHMNFDIKVYKGENHPLVRKTNPANFSHNYNMEFPSTNKTIENESAVDFMINTIKNSKEKITLFLLAPLTNFAKAFETDPSIVKNIEEIIIMGGAKEKGNIRYNPKAEYNIYSDADAANIVFNCGVKIKIFGTDVTNQVEFTDEIYDKFLKFNTKASNLTYNVMKGTFETWGDNILHDPVTVLYHLNNDIIQLKKYYSNVNTINPDEMGTDYGTMYFNEPDEENKANIEYSESINLKLYWEKLEYYVKQY